MFNGKEVQIDEELFERINLYPARYTLEVEIWSQLKEDYIAYWESFITKYLKRDQFSTSNRLYTVYEGFRSLPKYTRDTNQLSQSTLILRQIVRRQTPEVKRVFMEVIPQKLIGQPLTEESFPQLKECIKDFFGEHRQALNNLLLDLESEINLIYGGQDQLDQTLIKWFNGLDDDVKKHSHSKEINSFLNYIRKLETVSRERYDIIEKLSLIITGFNLEDWSDLNKEEFLNKLRGIKNTLERFKKGEKKVVQDFKITLETPNGKVERTLEKVEIQGIGKLLENKIRSSLYDVGSAVSDQQKQQILVMMLQEILG